MDSQSLLHQHRLSQTYIKVVPPPQDKQIISKQAVLFIWKWLGKDTNSGGFLFFSTVRPMMIKHLQGC